MLLATPAALLVAGFFLAPMVMLGRVSLFESAGRAGFYRPGTWTGAAYADLLTDSYFYELLAYTLELGLSTAVLCILLGFPLALLIARLPPRAKALALGAVILPKVANQLVIVYGLELLLSSIGPVNTALRALGMTIKPLELYHNAFGTLLGEVYFVLPYAVLVLVAGLDRIGPMLAPAARGLGAGPWRTFRRVTLPLALPSISLAFLLSLVFGMGAYVSPSLLGGPDQFTLSVDVARQSTEALNWPAAAAEGLMMLVALSVAAGLYGLGGMGLRAARQA